MPLYNYTAKNSRGETETKELEAGDERELATLLRSKGLVLVSAKLIETAKTTSGAKQDKKWILEQFFKNPVNFLEEIIAKIGGVSLVEKMIFSRHLAVMIDSGVALNQALKILAQQSENSKFKKIISNIENDIREGQAFSEGLAKYPKVFSSLYVNMIKAGEAGGNLSQVLKTLAGQMKKDHELISRIKGAMMYPIVVVIAMVAVGVLMMITVVPRLTEVFADMDIELPLTTQIVIGLSNFLREHSVLTVFALVGFIVLIRLAIRNKIVKEKLHQVFLVLPIFGNLVQKINSARLARTLSSLIKSGVAIVKSLEVVAGILTNAHFKNSMTQCSQQVQKGKTLSECLGAYTYKKLYPPMVKQMISIGEETGNLAEILENLADFYEEDIDNTTKNLSSIIEPIVMIVIGTVIGFFAISMVQPMYSMIGGV